MNAISKALICAALSGAGFFLSTNLGEVWGLAWLAPVPVLWLAFGEAKLRTVALAAYLALALGATNMVLAYGGLFPWAAFAVIFTVPPLLFALVVVASALVARRLHPLAGVVAFAALWTAWDFAASFGPDGTAPSPAYSQVGAPLLIQTAALFGLWSITFLIGLVAGALALSLRTRTIGPAVLGAGVFALNAGYGALRIADAPPDHISVGLIANDTIARAAFADDAKTALDAMRGYADAAAKLKGVSLIVLPEHFAILRDNWRAEAARALQDAADATGATIIAGLDEQTGSGRRNVAWVFEPRAKAPRAYVKRHLIPGLERAFTPGTSPLALPQGIAVEICKDMDFQAMVRADAVATEPRLFAVPAWDFASDRWPHARMAVLRSVESGVAMARAARDGLLTLNDAYGRVSAMRASDAAPGFVALVGEVAVAQQGGRTLYDRIGDIFGWLAAVLGLSLVVFALAKGALPERASAMLVLASHIQGAP